MGIARIVVRRSLAGRPGRTLFSTLGIALGVAVGVGVVALDHNTIRGLSAGELAARPDVRVRGAGGRRHRAEELVGTPGVRAAASYFQQDVRVRVLPGGEKSQSARVRLFAIDAPGLGELDALRVLEGRVLDPGRTKREALIGTPLAEELGIAVGDSLMLSRPRGAGRKACVDGEQVQVDRRDTLVLREEAFEVVGLLAREKLGARSRGRVVIIDFEWGEELFQGAHLNTSLWVKRDTRVDVERLRASLAEGWSYELDQRALMGQAADERAFRTGVRMAGLLALLLGLYVIFHTLSMSLLERASEIGTLHALGVTRGQVARLFLIEAMVMAGGGAILGWLGGVTLAYGLQRVGITTLGAGKWLPGFSIPWNTTLPLAGVGFVIALAGSVYPVMLLRGASTVATLRGEESLRLGAFRRGFHLFAALLLVVVLPGLYFVLVPVVGEFSRELVRAVLGGVGVVAGLIAFSFLMPSLIAGLGAGLMRPFAGLWPLAGRLAARAMQRGATRVAVGTAAIALVGGSFVALEGMTDGLRAEVEVWADEAVADKVFVRNLPALPWDEFAAFMHELPGVVALERGSARQHERFLLFGMDAEELSRFGPLSDQPELARRFAQGDAILLSRRLAAAEELEIGRPIWITESDGDVRELSVLLVTDAYGFFPDPDERLYGVVAADTLRSAYCVETETVTDLAVKLAPGSDPEVVEAGVLAYLEERKAPPAADGAPSPTATPSTRFDTGAWVRHVHTVDIDRDFILFDILIVLTALLAGLGVLNGQLLAALERTREFGILRSLGTTRGQIAGTVLLEALIVGLMGGLLGATLGTLATPLIVDAIEGLAGLALPSTSTTRWVIACIVGALVLAPLASLYPIWRATRSNLVRAIRVGG